jgi:hypothetical protein
VQLARFCASAGPSHWAALTHLIGYLMHRPSLKLRYLKGGKGGLDGFADSDWGNSVSRRSTSGLLARYNRAPILWRSRMQKTVALSSAEEEYYSASEIAVARGDHLPPQPPRQHAIPGRRQYGGVREQYGGAGCASNGRTKKNLSFISNRQRQVKGM